LKTNGVLIALREDLTRLGRVWLEDQWGINRPPQGAAPTGSGL